MSLPKPYYQDRLITLYHGDCREIMPALGSVDMVWTDPPYPAEFDWCWDALGSMAAPLMRPGSVLMTYCGHYQLPKVLSSLGRYLTYWWLFLARNHSAPAIWGYRLKATYKPIPAFFKDKQPIHLLPGLFPDDLHVAGSVRQAKALHEWGQGQVAEPILRFCPEGGCVLDPFAGSGTTLWTAKSHGRRSIGIEIDERHCETAAKRCSQELFDFATPRVAGLHGEGHCEKVEHDGRTGYLHDPNDDSAYSVDGVRYCGRCHGFMQ